jgi:predicted RNA-binding protein with RPS1 domain
VSAAGAHEQLLVINAARPSKQVNEESDQDSSHRNNILQDDGDENPDSSKRQRGKRRRGRVDTSRIVVEKHDESKPETKEFKEDPVVEAKRYCIGRKPVTDFKVGSTYSGKIVYSKPFGIFIDIGCHSDAFCHVSRLDDDFVEDVEQWRAERGDEVDAARVVEIDRKRKRITVSLQSEGRVEDERMSLEAREKRKQKRLQKRNGKSKVSTQYGRSTADPIEALPDKQAAVLSKDSNQSSCRNDDRLYASIPTSGVKGDAGQAMDSKTKAAEEKRQRKLARRAARRAMAETDKQ